MRRRWFLITLHAALVTMAAPLIASAAHAQTSNQQMAACNGSVPKYTLQQKVDGCTAQIEAGGLTSANLVSALLNRGNAYDDQKDYAHALIDYNEAIRLDSQNALAYYNRGLSYAHQSDYLRAIADYGEAIRLDPQ